MEKQVNNEHRRPFHIILHECLEARMAVYARLGGLCLRHCGGELA